jgi:hypothetical protein
MFMADMYRYMYRRTIRIQMSRKDDVCKLSSARWSLGMLAFRAIKIAIEDSWVAIYSQKNQSIGERLEESCIYKRRQ